MTPHLKKGDCVASLFTDTQLNGIDQTAWPVHCVQHSRGAAFAHGLPEPDLVVQKETNPRIDSYSAFRGNDGTNITKLEAHLRANNIKTIFVFGLAYEVCVGFTAKDAIKAGYNVILVEDATKGITTDGTQKMRAELLEMGARIMNADDAVRAYPQYFNSQA